MKNKTKKTKRTTASINTLSIQRRIYPVLVDKIAEIAKDNPGSTPTKIAAGLLCKQLSLPEPVRKNEAKAKEEAEAEAAKDEDSKSIIYQGMSMVQKQVEDFLMDLGVKPIEPVGSSG